jgi:imidazolonepropionase-like amidohydrolase
MRIELDDPPNIIRSATRINAALLMQSGNLGTISPGAYGDLLVVEGDPLSDVKVMTDPQKNLKLIMKDGVIYKNESLICIAAIARVRLRELWERQRAGADL